MGLSLIITIGVGLVLLIFSFVRPSVMLYIGCAVAMAGASIQSAEDYPYLAIPLIMVMFYCGVRMIGGKSK